MSSRWSSSFGFIMATAGAAVGLGNLWKFPYMVGTQGGSAFILLYVGFVLLGGIPLLLAEVGIGRMAHRNPVNALSYLAQKFHRSPRWSLLGWWGMVGMGLILSFYSVISGWSLGYLWRTAGGQLENATADSMRALWGQFMNSPQEIILWHTAFMGMTGAIVAKGVQKGIEKASILLMPLLLVVLVALDIYGSTTSGFLKTVSFFCTPDFSHINQGVVLEALGQAFFSLALGAGCMCTYGAYLPDHVSLTSAVVIIALVNLLVALLAGFAIFPFVFTYGLEPNSGPSLMFQVLPVAFAHLALGKLWGLTFFLLLIFAALTSSISLLEPLVMLLQERKGVSRGRATILISTVIWALGLISLFSFNEWSSFQPFGRNLFEWIVTLSTDFILPIGGLFWAIFVGWALPSSVLESLFLPQSPGLGRGVRWLIRWVVPGAMGMIFFMN
jgi:NSS family neurotransmitter:Na+ symporter